MSECNQCVQWLKVQAWQDGELDEAASRAAESHMRGCPACAQELAALIQIRHHLNAWAQERRLEAGWMNRLEPLLTALDRQRSILRIAQTFMTGAAAILAITFTIGLGDSQYLSGRTASGRTGWASGRTAPAWEGSMVWMAGPTEPDEPAVEESRLASWIVSDLTGEIPK